LLSKLTTNKYFPEEESIPDLWQEFFQNFDARLKNILKQAEECYQKKKKIVWFASKVTYN
jgi:hypothetical protein